MNRFQRYLRVILTLILFLLGLAALTVAIIAGVFLFENRTNGSLISSGETRRYLLYVPESYDAAKPAPLVITIHGFAQWPAHQAHISHWNNLADEYGFIVVYPEGTGFPKRWRAGQTEGESDPAIEIRFFNDLIDKLESEYSIDPARVYANGLSNGGGMSYVLGCLLSERIAAIGGVSGAYGLPLEDCDPGRVVPMIAFHGTVDPIVPYEGGESGDGRFNLPNIPAWMRERALLNGCDSDPRELPGTGDASVYQYVNCDEDAEVIFYSVAGSGHGWPGGEPIAAWIVGPTSQNVDATRLIWDFFQKYSLDQQ